ncbi:dTDP-D-glucose 4,6-dehydratase [Aulographum hederae CBS 113979]|uniref:dTDP-D-glucose 4,6-dehydratase n=1 Tax=Aulographum hederae CBS 113979 TaxID=1176131 RepID=A0A6G1H010_9PEZI|nr:dTDP-D-glucose 4,6-dehydratase [Aulographum hederae CBS 113979]
MTISVQQSTENTNGCGSYTPCEPLANVKTILVTGGAGFIGGWFIRHLLCTYGGRYTVICYDSLSYCASLLNISPLLHLPNFHFITGSISDLAAVESLFRTHKIDAVLHFAANSHVDNSFEDPLSFTETNVLGTHVLLETARRLGDVKRFVHVSTDEVYGENDARDGLGFEESDPLNPSNPYSASKAAAEMIALAYKESFQMPIIVTRCNNVFGPHQYPEKLIPRFATLLLANEKLTLHGRGTTTRSFLHASDAATAFDIILHRGLPNETYNISSRNALQVREVGHKILCFFGRRSKKAQEPFVEMVQDRVRNDRMYLTDCEKLRGLGWEEKMGFEEGLEGTLEWYCQFGSTFWGENKEKVGLDTKTIVDGEASDGSPGDAEDCSS